MSKRKSNDINSQPKQNKKQKQNLEFCIKSEMTGDQLMCMLKNYANLNKLIMYLNISEWNKEYEKMMNKSFECFIKIVPNYSKDQFKKTFVKIKPNNPHLYNWYSIDEILTCIATNVNDLYFKQNIMQYVNYSELLKIYEKKNFDINSTISYISFVYK